MTVYSQADVVAYPATDALTSGLTAVLRQHGIVSQPVAVLDRQPNVHASTFPSEIITCTVDGSRQIRLFCKYEGDCDHAAHGHRGGIDYEATVYEHVLTASSVSLPRYYGTYRDASSNRTWLVLGFLENCIRASRVSTSIAMLEAAKWLGCFHSANESRMSEESMRYLKVYDSAYYRGWAQRTNMFGSIWHERFPWLKLSCKRFETLVDNLLEGPRTVIHGEYYPNNVLYCDGRIYPVDWESAAIAAGEIDLATLTEHWPAEIARECTLKYAHARWREDIPSEFEGRLALARLYLLFRWLGDRPEWTSRKEALRRVQEVRELASHLRLI